MSSTPGARLTAQSKRWQGSGWSCRFGTSPFLFRQQAASLNCSSQQKPFTTADAQFLGSRRHSVRWRSGRKFARSHCTQSRLVYFLLLFINCRPIIKKHNLATNWSNMSLFPPFWHIAEAARPERPPKPERLLHPSGNGVESNNNIKSEPVATEEEAVTQSASGGTLPRPAPRPQPPLPPAKPRPVSDNGLTGGDSTDL